MLGVCCAEFTLAACGLQKRGLIRYHRGEMTMLDLTGLEAAGVAATRYRSACTPNLWAEVLVRAQPVSLAGSLIMSRVPRPAAELTVSVPRSASMRYRMPTRP